MERTALEILNMDSVDELELNVEELQIRRLFKTALSMNGYLKVLNSIDSKTNVKDGIDILMNIIAEAEQDRKKRITFEIWLRLSDKQKEDIKETLKEYDLKISDVCIKCVDEKFFSVPNLVAETKKGIIKLPVLVKDVDMWVQQ